MSTATGPSPAESVLVIYDGECPFCSSYARLVRLRQNVGPVELVDARARPDLVRELTTAGFDLDEGMVVKSAGEIFHGADAVHWLSVHSTDGAIGRFHRLLLGNRTMARWAYPFLRAGRNAALRLLARRKIGAQ